MSDNFKLLIPWGNVALQKRKERSGGQENRRNLFLALGATVGQAAHPCAGGPHKSGTRFATWKSGAYKKKREREKVKLQQLKSLGVNTPSCKMV